jgi:hypothetical protein
MTGAPYPYGLTFPTRVLNSAYAAVLPPAGPISGGGSGTYSVPFSGTLSASGVPAADLSGLTITLTVSGTGVGTATTGSGGSFSGSFNYTTSATPGTVFTVSASFAGATVANYTLGPSSASDTFTIGTETVSTSLTLNVT